MTKIKTPFIHRLSSEIQGSRPDYSFWFSDDLSRWTSSGKKVQNDKLIVKRRNESHKKKQTQSV